ncbi:MAG: hypothetical protein K0S61_4779 [Anaerocolumna sp.]|jgi:recombination protein U|nr:hypothetical protein [Anaerocolumna sp.]
MNSGKVFEEDIKKSINDKYFIYKLKDSAGTWQGGNNTRFTSSNICDYIVFANGWLHLLELKSHKGASIPIAPIKNKQGKITKYGAIRTNQVEGLFKEYCKPKMNCGFIFNLSDKEKTWFVDILNIKVEIERQARSLSLEWLEMHGVLIPQEKKRTRYKYDLSVILD